MKRSMKKAVSLTLAAGVLALAVAGCSQKTGPSSSDAGSSQAAGSPASSQTQQVTGHITVYTSESQDLVTDMLEDFVSRNPGITYNLYRSGSGDVISKLSTELQAGGTEADIIWFADMGYIHQLDGQGLIEHYTPAAAADIDPKFNYNDGMAFEVRQIFNIIAVNTLKNTVDIQDWADLCKPELAGKFAMADPSYSGGAFTTLVTLTQEGGPGWELYQGMRDNDVKFEQSNGNLQTKLSSGEYQAVSVVDFMIRNAQADGAPVEIIWPKSGAVMVPTPIAMLSTVKEENRAACHAFLDYLLSEDGQKLFVEQGYIPVRDGVGVPEGAPNVAELNVCGLDIDYFVNESSQVRAKYEEIFGQK